MYRQSRIGGVGISVPRVSLSDHRIARDDAVGLEVVLGQLVQRAQDAGQEIGGVAFLHRRAQPVGDDGAGGIGSDGAG